MRHKKSWFAAIGLAALIFPLGVFALTPEQSLDKAVKSLDTMTSYKMDIDMNMDIGERVIGKSGSGVSGKIAIKLGTRILDKHNGEGRLSLERFSVTGVESGETIAFTLDQPIAIEWSLTGEKIYFRLAQVPSMVVDYLKTNLEIDLTPIIGVWIGMDAPNGVSDIKNLPIISTQSLTQGLPQNNATLNALRKLPVFRVLSIEKRMKNAAGDDLMRMRVRINPALINAVQQAEIKALPRDRYYRDDLTAINKRYTELRRNLGKLFMAINLNVTKNRIERMEIGGNIEEPMETCTYNNSLRRSVCKVTSYRVYKIAIGISMSPAGSQPIYVPLLWKTMEEIQKILMPPVAEPIEEDPLVQTLTNDGT